MATNQSHRHKSPHHDIRVVSCHSLPPPPPPSLELIGESSPPYSHINSIRDRVAEWRNQGYPNTSPTTRRLLQFWNSDEIEPRLFFAQKDAIETLIWYLEAAPRSSSETYREAAKYLQLVNDELNQGIFRVATKMATGTGKTVVMAMVIIWKILSGERNFLVLTPGHTVRERLRDLIPNRSPLFEQLTPPGNLHTVKRGRVCIRNYQAFQPKTFGGVKKGGAVPSATALSIIHQGDEDALKQLEESPGEMLRRVIPFLGQHRIDDGKKIIVLNDEAHHCYFVNREQATSNQRDPQSSLDKEEKSYESKAGQWFNILQLLSNDEVLDTVFDFSATPMFLRPPPKSAYVPPTEIFPWTISDYPLIEAIEAGLTKVPRVPVMDNTRQDAVAYRNLFHQTSGQLIVDGDLNDEISELLVQIHGHYKNVVMPEYASQELTPVIIVVANTIANATYLYQHIAGYHDLESGQYFKGKLPLFSNVRQDQTGIVEHPPTLLVHSALDQADDQSGGGWVEIAKQQREIHCDITESVPEQKARIREIFNSVGKVGHLGEHIRCIVSVSMLTEGWDAKTVTHVIGYRQFRSQLLCEQVAGRALRRTGFPNLEQAELLGPQYANIFGIPFACMASEGNDAVEPIREYRVRSVAKNRKYRVAFPLVSGYRLVHHEREIVLHSERIRDYTIKPTSKPSTTHIQWVAGEELVLESHPRYQHTCFRLAVAALNHMEVRKTGSRLVLFATMLAAVQEWLNNPKVNRPSIEEISDRLDIDRIAAEIARCCVDHESDLDSAAIAPIFEDEREPMSRRARSADTRNVNFTTSLCPYYPSDRRSNLKRSELNRAHCHSSSEVAIARFLDSCPDILAWVRNYKLKWYIPYCSSKDGRWHHYEPDFIARGRVLRLPTDEASSPQERHLVIEFKGIEDVNSEDKRKATEEWWIPAVNGSVDDACKGEWRYVYITDEASIASTIMAHLR